MSRPSDGFELDELRDEFDWTHEFLSRMAERITHDQDVHNLVDYVNKLEAENAKLQEQIYWLKKGDVLHVLTDQELADQQKHEREMRASIDALEDENARLRSCLSDDTENARQIMGENAKLREERDEWHRVAVSKQDIIDHMRDVHLLMNSNPTATELRRVRHAWKNDRNENTKLRKLIQKVWKWESNGCYECPLEKDCKVLCVYDGDCGMAVEIEKELQELGIEADE